jgi:hypothetical protein
MAVAVILAGLGRCYRWLCWQRWKLRAEQKGEEAP